MKTTILMTLLVLFLAFFCTGAMAQYPYYGNSGYGAPYSPYYSGYAPAYSAYGYGSPYYGGYSGYGYGGYGGF